MLHPIFAVLVRRPELVIDHMAGYAALVQEEASAVGKELVKRAVAWGVAAFALLLFLIFTGVAVMLGATAGAFHWVLVVVPGVALAVAVVAWLLARQSLPSQAFTELKAQLDADAQALRAVGAQA